MVTIEQVERLREKANVSYAEAKEALEKCDGDLLDAILYLEEKGKVKSSETDQKHSREYVCCVSQKDEGHNKKHRQRESYAKPDGKDDFYSLWDKFWRWCKVVIKKGCVNTFEVYRYGQPVICIPVVIFILLLVFAFWVTVPLLIIGLFFGFKYLFGGPDLREMDLNKAMDAAAGAAQNAKNEFKSASDDKNPDNAKNDEQQ